MKFIQRDTLALIHKASSGFQDGANLYLVDRANALRYADAYGLAVSDLPNSVLCASGCTEGGQGSSSCSISTIIKSCSVTCQSGYYACCSLEGGVKPRCVCCKESPSKLYSTTFVGSGLVGSDGSPAPEMMSGSSTGQKACDLLKSVCIKGCRVVGAMCADYCRSSTPPDKPAGPCLMKCYKWETETCVPFCWDLYWACLDAN